MGNEGLIAAAVGLSVGGFLLWRARRADVVVEQPPAPQGSAGSDPCALLTAAGPQALAACKALQVAAKVGAAIVDALDGPDWDKMDKENKAANGEVELPLDAGLKTFSMCRNPAAGGEMHWALLNGSVLRFKNGCVPFEGAQGWALCAAGTKNMFRKCDDLWHKMPETPIHGGDWTLPLDQKGEHRMVDVWARAIGAMVPGDPTTYGPIRAGESDWRYTWSTGKRRPIKFPLPIPTGKVGWYLGGRAIVCDEGVLPTRVRDHTGRHEYTCGAFRTGEGPITAAARGGEEPGRRVVQTSSRATPDDGRARSSRVTAAAGRTPQRTRTKR